MTPQTMGWVWVASIAMAGSFGLTLFLFSAHTGASAWLRTLVQDPAPVYDTVFIGSSLTGAAIPKTQGAASHDVMGPHVRHWMPLISSRELERQITRALRDRPKRLFVELRPMIRPDDPARITLRVNSASERMRHAVTTLLAGGRLEDWTTRDSIWTDGDVSTIPKDARQSDEIRLATPDTRRLAALIARAEAQDADLYFISLPRAASAATRGQDTSWTDVRRAIEGMARDLNRPLFAPDLTWPDRYFADRMHLNARGQARYMAELQTWFAAL